MLSFLYDASFVPKSIGMMRRKKRNSPNSSYHHPILPPPSLTNAILGLYKIEISPIYFLLLTFLCSKSSGPSSVDPTVANHLPQTPTLVTVLREGLVVPLHKPWGPKFVASMETKYLMQIISYYPTSQVKMSKHFFFLN